MSSSDAVVIEGDVPHMVQRLIEMKAMTAERTRGERDRKERRRQEKEASKLREQCVPAVNVLSSATMQMPGYHWPLHAVTPCRMLAKIACCSQCTCCWIA